MDAEGASCGARLGGAPLREKCVAKIPGYRMMSAAYAVRSFHSLPEHIMSKTTQKAPMTQQQRDHHGDQRNPNHGTPGTNRAYDAVQGNRGKQLNPNQK